VLAHEFGHYYAGDTRLGPWVYNTRKAIVRVFENLGKKSPVLQILTRWWIVALPYMALMRAMSMYWKAFMHITQAISRKQEFRSDELACHVAGSNALIGGLEGIQRCAAVTNSYWSLVMPLATNGFQPQIADGFQRYMTAPRIAKATAEFVAKQNAERKPSPLDTHPPMEARIAMAKFYNLPAPDDAGVGQQADRPMISLINDLGELEGGLLKKFVPMLEKVELKSVSWEAAGTQVLVPMWRKKVAGFVPLLSTRTLKELPALVKTPGAIMDMVPQSPGKQISLQQLDARAMDVLFSGLALCLVDNGWTLISEPGDLHLEQGDSRLDPGAIIAEMKSGKLTPQEWESYCTQRGMSDWTLATLQPAVV